MPDPLSDVVGGIVTDFIGSLFGGGGDKRYSAGDKRKILLETAARYGTESPQYQDLAKRWPKQAKKVGRYELPTGASAPPPPTPASQSLQPIIFTSVERGRGYPTGRPPTVDELMTGANIALAVTSAYGALTSLGRNLLAALFKRRAKLELGKIASRVGAARAKAAAKGLTGRGQELEAEKILEAEAKIARIQKVGPVAVKSATKTATKVAAKVSRSSIKQNVLGGTAAGTAAAIVQEIIARAKGGSQLPEKAPVSPGAPGGATAPSSASSVGGAPTGSQVSGTAAAPGQSQGDTRVAPSSSEKAAAARSATREAAEKAKRNASAFIASAPPTWLTLLGSAAPIVARSSASSRGPMSEPESPPLPQPAPGGAPLTGFGPGGVASCDCKPKRRSGKRKKRTVCYTGRFTETATGTLKYEKRRRTTCQPSKKRPASQRAQ